MGLGVGRSPPPGRIPATAFAGANSDKALASSGIDPTGKQKQALGENFTDINHREHMLDKEKKNSLHTAFLQIRFNKLVTLQIREEFP